MEGLGRVLLIQILQLIILQISNYWAFQWAPGRLLELSSLRDIHISLLLVFSGFFTEKWFVCDDCNKNNPSAPQGLKLSLWMKLCSSTYSRLLISNMIIIFENCSPNIPKYGNFGLKLNALLLNMKLCKSNSADFNYDNSFFFEFNTKTLK